MTAEQFTQWLDGFLQANESTTLNATRVAKIKDKLAKITDPITFPNGYNPHRIIPTNPYWTITDGTLQYLHQASPEINTTKNGPITITC